MGLYLGSERKFIATTDAKCQLQSRYYFTNQVSKSINADGSIFNVVGYQEGYRLSSSGALKVQDKAVVTGFIPATEKDKIRMSGVQWGSTANDGYCYIAFYDNNFNLLSTANKYGEDTATSGVSNLGSSSSSTNVLNKDKTSHNIVTDENGVTTFNMSYIAGKTFAYIRISAQGNGENMIVTINEEIKIQ